MRILIAAAQLRGLHSTGGLGDVVAGLSRALAARGDVTVRLVLPHPGRDLPGTRVRHDRLDVPMGDRVEPVRVETWELPGSPPLTCDLLQLPQPPPHDSPAEAVLLSRGALALARLPDGFHPDVIHAHDWHAGLVAAYRTLRPAPAGHPDPAVVFTTHNLGPGFQGEFPDPAAVARLAGLDLGNPRHPDPRAGWLEPAGHFNCSGAGLAFADAVNTVSPTYALELRSASHSGSLAPLVQHRTDLVGILNGLDLDEWDPARDPALGDVPFAADWPVPRVIGHKHALRQRLRDHREPADGLAAYPFSDLADSSILLASIGRIDRQKLPILAEALPELITIEGVQVVLLGEAHPRDAFGQDLAARLQALARASAGRFLMDRGFDPELSHRIYAASDMLLVPSLYEPCGLTQLVAMRYGTVPVVRATGGLADTVVDAATAPDANGFSFREPVSNPAALADVPAGARLLVRTVRHAVTLLRQNPVRWTELVRHGMQRDSGWTRPAEAYLALYRQALAAHRAR